MLTQLKKNKLEVGLGKAPESKHSNHSVRVINNTNPKWYQELCEKYPTTNRKNKLKRRGKKHHDTKIKRQRIIQALMTLSEGRMAQSIYANDLLELASDLQNQWKEEKDAELRVD